MTTRRILLASPLPAAPALAQSRRPLRVIVPFPPGGAVNSPGCAVAPRWRAMVEPTGARPG